jgi:hypothetical protein
MAVTLVGRRNESAVLARLIVTVREGRSSVLVLRSKAGVGKTALLENALKTALGFRVVRTDDRCRSRLWQLVRDPTPTPPPTIPTP